MRQIAALDRVFGGMSHSTSAPPQPVPRDHEPATAPIDPLFWKRADDAPGRRCLRAAIALEIALVTRGMRPYFGDPDLATCALERALDEDETLAVSVFPDRIFWMVDAWPGADAMRTLLRQTAEYSEICGAPAGKVWPRGFWYRPIATWGEARSRAEEMVRDSARKELVRQFGRWPACEVVSSNMMSKPIE